jgi:hypothetical protein
VVNLTSPSLGVSVQAILNMHFNHVFQDQCCGGHTDKSVGLGK